MALCISTQFAKPAWVTNAGAQAGGTFFTLERAAYPVRHAAWQEVGYTTEKLLDAGRQIIDASMTAFPDQYDHPCDRWGTATSTRNVNYAARNAVPARAGWPGRLIVQKNSLATSNPPAPGTDTVYQVLWTAGAPARISERARMRNPAALSADENQSRPQDRQHPRRRRLG
ncbi:MAG: hypothetical protein H0V54_13470 [Chthoniobacterales bacterium]|nr:hypothetical protein [Chthoniobacterales bacterium]